MSSDKTPITPAARKRVGLALLTVAGAVLLGAVIVVLVVWRGGATAPSASGEADRPRPSSSTGPVQLGTATPVPTDAAPTDSRIPTDCTSLYTTDWSASLAPLVLNPAWTTEAQNGPWVATDSALASQLQAATELTCNWASPAGGSGQGVITNVASIATDQQEQLVASIGALGFSCYDELGGLRCVTESTGDGTAVGESHFIRDGIWLATKWIEVSPDGYTHDMVNAIFDGA